MRVFGLYSSCGIPAIASARPDRVFVDEFCDRYVQILGRRAFADPADRIVMRAMAWAEPAIIIAGIDDRHTAEMRADSDLHEPLAILAQSPVLDRGGSIAPKIVVAGELVRKIRERHIRSLGDLF